MSVSSLLKALRIKGQWTKQARIIYTTRRLVAFFEKYPDLVPVALGKNPSNRVLWDGIYRFFFRHYPVKINIYFEHGKEKERPWWYSEETFDPKWDKLLHEYKALNVFRNIICPYLEQQKR